MSVAQVVAGNINFNPNFQQTNSSGLIAPQTLSAILPISTALQYANATGQALGVDQLYAVSIALVSTTTTIHFQTSTLHDLFGGTLAMLRIREFIVVNTNTTLGQDLKVESSASNGITWLPPSTSPLFARSGTTDPTKGYGVLRISDPASFGGGVGNVIDSTHDGVTFDSGANTVTFYVIALGCSVA